MSDRGNEDLESIFLMCLSSHAAAAAPFLENRQNGFHKSSLAILVRYTNTSSSPKLI